MSKAGLAVIQGNEIAQRQGVRQGGARENEAGKGVDVAGLTLEQGGGRQ